MLKLHQNHVPLKDQRKIMEYRIFDRVNTIV